MSPLPNIGSETFFYILLNFSGSLPSERQTMSKSLVNRRTVLCHLHLYYNENCNCMIDKVEKSSNIWKHFNIPLQTMGRITWNNFKSLCIWEIKENTFWNFENHLERRTSDWTAFIFSINSLYDRTVCTLNKLADNAEPASFRKSKQYCISKKQSSHSERPWQPEKWANRKLVKFKLLKEEYK